MTEQEWLASDDPSAMLRCVNTPSSAPGNPPCVSDRKLRLFAVACCRQVWDRLTDVRSRRAVEVAERFADGQATDGELESAGAAACESWRVMPGNDRLGDVTGAMMADEACDREAVSAADFMIRPIVLPSTAVVAALLRDVVGNPFRPVRKLACLRCGGSGKAVYHTHMPGPGHVRTDCRDCGGTGGDLDRPWLAWNGGTVRKLAQAIYDERAFDRLPILADALVDAGCDDWRILSHLRIRPSEEHVRACGTEYRGCAPACPKRLWEENGPHVRGCWALDLLLGLE